MTSTMMKTVIPFQKTQVKRKRGNFQIEKVIAKLIRLLVKH